MNYKILSGLEEIGQSRWFDFLINHKNATVFQMPEMYHLYLQVPGYSPIVMAIESDEGKLTALLLAVIIKDYKGLAGTITARCVVYGGPIISAHEIKPLEIVDQLLSALIEKVKRHSLFIQFRNFTDSSALIPIFSKHGFEIRDHLNLIVNTSDANETLSSISKSKIRQARRSNFSGAELIKASTEEEIHSFYQILKKVYKNKVRKPLPPKSFFISFFRATQQGKLGIIFIAKYKEKVVGGMVCPITPGKALSEWYVCGLDKQFREIYPSVFLTYGAIDYALKNNIRRFDFMGIGSPEKPYGVRDFKISFGGEVVNYGRSQRINNPILFPIARLGFSLLSYLHLV